MREQLNNNPMVQVGVVAVLMIAAAVFLFLPGGGEGGEGSGEGASTTVTVGSPEGAGAPAGGATQVPRLPSAAAPAIPRRVSAAWKADRTVALLFVHAGGIDDRLVRSASSAVAAQPGVSLFVVPVRRIARYAAITEGVGVDRVPALVVVTPKHLDRTVTTASVLYGYQSPARIVQAVIDAGYEGPTLDYHP